MKCTDGLFYETARKVAKDYEGKIEYEEKLVDNMCMQLVQKPQNYDVLVLPNLYGDILSDLCAGLVGGLGVAPGANIGDDFAVFEASHGSAPKYKGLNKVNPIAVILSAKMMLDYIGQKEAANALDKAVAQTISAGKNLTYDLGGTAGTKEIGQEIIDRLKG
jgi:isocitrate dehydrogenase (NAD+)